MEEKKKEIKKWISQHKKELAFAGISLVTVIIAVAAIKNRKELEKLFLSLKGAVEKTSQAISAPDSKKAIASNMSRTGAIVTENVVEASSIVEPICKSPHYVCGHVRNLHEGYKASEKKIAQAAEAGILLMPGQTLVNSYKTGICVA